MAASPPTLADIVPGAPAIPVRSVTADSRKAQPGSVFVAVPGTKADGLSFAAAAAAAGAVAIIGDAARPAALPDGTAYVQVSDPRRTLALLAARLHPGQPRTVVAVTGTSGKSSVAEFTRQLYAAIGREGASLGTIGVVTAAGARYGSLTTPDPVSLHETLSGLAEDGITHLAMEASSHGIEQRRLDGVRLAAAAFTNLGRDHLDYHPTIGDYLKAKLRLFDTLLESGRPALVNADGAYADSVIAAAREHGLDVRTTGRFGDTIRLDSVRAEGFGQRIRAFDVRAGESREVLLPLVGAFQVENALLAAGLAMATESAQLSDLASGLAALAGVPGRLERVGEVRGALCVIDYAHKPDALAGVLAALRPFATGRLVCVFGCGGDRDRGKRPIMGRIAAEKADAVIVTDDNPRSELPDAIRAEILAAAPGAREIGDREEAIRTAVSGLGPGDVLVVAGKGHETGQIIGDRVLAFSDHDVVRRAIAELT